MTNGQSKTIQVPISNLNDQYTEMDWADYVLHICGQARGRDRRVFVNSYGYAKICINGKGKYLHRVIMDCPEGLYVDHKNRKRRDNRRSNLRIVTIAENNRNRDWYEDDCKRKVRVRGIVETKGGRFAARISVNKGKNSIWLGTFDTKLQAILAWNEEAIKLGRKPNNIPDDE